MLRKPCGCARRNPCSCTQENPRLTRHARERLPASDFVFPRTRKWPIQDPAQAMTALSWSDWPQHKSVQSRVQRTVKSRYPKVWRDFKGYKAIRNPPTLPGYGRKHEYWNEDDDVVRGPAEFSVGVNPPPKADKKGGWTAIVAGHRKSDNRYVFGHVFAKTLKAAKKAVVETVENRRKLGVCRALNWRKVADVGMVPAPGRAAYIEEYPRLMLLVAKGDWHTYLGHIGNDVSMSEIPTTPPSASALSAPPPFTPPTMPPTMPPTPPTSGHVRSSATIMNPGGLPGDLPEVLAEARQELLDKLRSRQIMPRSYKGWTVVIGGYMYGDATNQYGTKTETFRYLKEAKTAVEQAARYVDAIGYGEHLQWRKVKGLPGVGYVAEHPTFYGMIFKGDWTNYL